MPCALRDLQEVFADHLAGFDQAVLVAEIVGDTIPAASRLNVYRHHVRHSLANALAATFPTVQALVGEQFFRGLAHAFVGRCLPAQPVLSEYGADLASFIASYAPAHGLPYLSDVARLDWALNSAFHVPSVDGVSAADLAALPAERLPTMSLVLTPGAALIESIHPLGRIWQASQPGAGSDFVDLEAGAARLLVLRRPDDAAFIELGPSEAVFVRGLIDGAPIGTAATVAFQAGAFDLSTAFARLLDLRVIAAVQ
ncbi:MAG: DNA-binding domain-containing protein [Reyranellaceae bacterium]